MKMLKIIQKHIRYHVISVLSVMVIIMFFTIVYLSKIVITNSGIPCTNPDHIIKEKIISRISKDNVFNSKHKLAVLVPYRDRFEELLVFVPYIHRFLNEQKINHNIFILNQVDGYRFNRASLINVGYLHTKDTHDYIAMHDVDLLPLNKNLSYAFPKNHPHHVAAPDLHPRYHYSKFVGGIFLINCEHFQLVNGMSNKYWGWGLEDDEFYVRIKDANLNITRPVNITTGTTDTFKHIHDKNKRKRDTVKCYNQREVTRRRDRQTGLHDVKYKIHNVNSLVIDEAPMTIINIELICDHSLTPWCDCSEKKNDTKLHSPDSL